MNIEFKELPDGDLNWDHTSYPGSGFYVQKDPKTKNTNLIFVTNSYVTTITLTSDEAREYLVNTPNKEQPKTEYRFTLNDVLRLMGAGRLNPQELKDVLENVDGI